ncbi:MAG: hypothetical protein IPL84_16905 [Chitinophagaceae bacterium]|nr:hypothetical protein [Chitinophagaceae bacterium]
MKFHLLRNLLLLTIFLMLGNRSFSQANKSEKTEQAAKVKKVKKPKVPSLMDEDGKQVGEAADDFEGALNYDFNLTKNPVTGKIPDGIRKAELAQARQVLDQQGDNFENLGSYSFQGPDNLGGRTRSIVYDVRFNGTTNRIILAGGVSGGVYKTIDNGASWVRKSPTGDLFSVSTIAQDPRPGFQDTWYYAGGEWTGNSASAVGASYRGKGVYKSIDNGETWTFLPASNTGVLESFDHRADYIMKLAVDPTNGNVYMAALDAVYRSTDGGTTWGIVLTSGSGSFGTGMATDITVTPSGRFYAAFAGTGNTAPTDMPGVWTSTTGALASWTKIAGSGSGTSPAGWNANGTYGRVVVAYAPSDPDKLYALYWNGINSTCGGPAAEAELFRWSLVGGSWTDLSSTLPDEAGCLEGNDPFAVQGGYDLVVAVKPDDATAVFIGGTNAYRSTTSGTSWTRIGGYASPASYALYASSHPDIHAFAFEPGTPSTMLCGNDGGIQRTTAVLAGTVAWTPINSGYRTYQYYYVDVDPRSANTKVIGGAQDNGTTRNIGGAGTSFESIFGGDGVSVGLSDPAASGGTQYEYVGFQNGAIYRRASTGPSGTGTDIRPTAAVTDGLFVTLFKVDPDNSNTLYYANNNSLYRTTSASTVTTGTWTSMTGIATAVGGANQISAIGLSRGAYSAATSSLFLGTSNGKVYRLNDPTGVAAGTAPVDITGAGFPATGWVSSISTNPRNDDTVLVTFSNYGVASAFWTGDANSVSPTWTAVEGNIPLPSYRSSAIAITTSGVSYFVGTSAGLYSVTGLPGFTTWAQEGPTDMGNAVVSNLSLRASDNKLLVGTHGYAMWYSMLPTPAAGCAATLTSAAGTDAQTVCNGTAITPITYSTTGATGATFTGLPAGVTGVWSGGVITISGTPTASGSFSYTATLTGAPCTGETATGTITVNPLPVVTNPALAVGYVGTAFSQTFTAAGGTPAYTFTTGSTLPGGFTLATTGVLSGTAAATGTFPIVVTATDANTCAGSSSTYTLVINPATLETWELSAEAGSQVSSAPATTATNISAGTLTRGPGVTAGAAGGSISSSGWFNTAGVATTLTDAIANGEYYEFTLPVNAGFTADVTAVAFYLRSSATGPNTATLRSSADGFTADLGTTTITTTSALSNLPVTLTGISGTLTFRLYGYGGAAGGGSPGTSGTFRIGSSPVALANDLDIFGTTAAAGACSATLTSAAGTDAQTVCISTAITPITYSTVGATGATFTGLPAGVTGGWSGNVITISGTPTASGSFNYTATLTGGPCTVETVTGIITVTANNTVTLTSAVGTNAQTITLGAAITTITYATTGATGATVTGLPPGVTGVWVANVVTISGTPTATGTFSYTVTLTGGCGTVTALGSITVNPPGNTITLTSAAGTDAQTVCISTAIVPITYATTGATGATFSGLPAGVTGTWAASVVTISGTPTVSGSFSYTVTLTGGSGTGTATGSITVTANNTVTLTSAAGTNAQTVCISTPITTITYSTTGATGATVTGLPAGVTGSWSANVVTISGTPTASGPFSYTVTLTGGCGTITATGSITVTANNTVILTSAAGTNAQTVCISTPITTITYATTGATGATVTGLPAGVTGSWAANVVTISGTPTASGPFSYTVTLTGGCGTITATGSITVTANNTVILTSAAGTNAQTVCISTPITSITYATTGATGATVTGLPAGVTGSWAGNVVTISGTPTVAGPFSYTVTLTGGCGAITATGSITVTANNTVTLTSAAGTNAQTITLGSPIVTITYLTTGATGASVTGLPGGVTGGWAANVVTISGTPTATGTFSYTVTLTGGCGTVTATGSITVNPPAGPVNDLCVNALPITCGSTVSGTTVGATFDAAGTCVTTNTAPGVWYSFTGDGSYVTLSTCSAGTGYDTKLSVFSGSCGSLVCVTGNDDDFTCGFSIFQSKVAFQSITGTTYFVLVHGFGAATGVFDLNMTCCTPHTITLTSAAGTDAQTVCNNSPIIPVTYTTTGATGATFTGLPAGVTGTWVANAITISGTPTVSGVFPYTITLTGAGSCGVVTGTGTITVNPIPDVAQPANQAVCNGVSTAPVVFTGSVPGTVFNWTNSNPSIGLAATGTGNIASFTATNATTAPAVATITVTPSSSSGSVIPVPELLYYDFEGTGTSIPNLASAPPPGTATADIVGGQTQGVSGLCGSGSLVGVGLSSTTNYVNTHWATNLGTSSWTMSFKTSNITPSATLFYILGDGGASSFRCFTNGVAGANNWMLRGPVSDVLVPGGATIAPHTITFVYDNTLNNIKAYLDGVLVNTVAQGALNINGAGPFKVGAYSGNTGLNAGGLMDEFRLYNRAITPAEIVLLAGCPSAGGLTCSGSSKTFTITVNPTPDVNQPANQVVCNNFPTAPVNFTGSVLGTVFNWTNSNPAIGLAASGTGNIASFTAPNAGTTPVVANITVRPAYSSSSIGTATRIDFCKIVCSY